MLIKTNLLNPKNELHTRIFFLNIKEDKLNKIHINENKNQTNVTHSMPMKEREKNSQTIIIIVNRFTNFKRKYR